jgi:hypothetical protein
VHGAEYVLNSAARRAGLLGVEQDADVEIGEQVMAREKIGDESAGDGVDTAEDDVALGHGADGLRRLDGLGDGLHDGAESLAFDVGGGGLDL